MKKLIKMKKLIDLIALAGLAALGTSAARADLIGIALDNPNQTGFAGETLSFTGVITNLDPDNTVNIDNLNFVLNGDDFSYDYTDDFNSNVPFFLIGGASSTDIELFTVSINATLVDPFGPYSGTYNLIGGEGQVSDQTLGSESFTVTTAAPEPGALTLLVGGIPALILFRRKAMRSREQNSPRGDATACSRCGSSLR